jgi:hypothetical protein
VVWFGNFLRRQAEEGNVYDPASYITLEDHLNLIDSPLKSRKYVCTSAYFFNSDLPVLKVESLV